MKIWDSVYISMDVVHAGMFGWMPWMYRTYPDLVSLPPKDQSKNIWFQHNFIFMKKQFKRGLSMKTFDMTSAFWSPNLFSNTFCLTESNSLYLLKWASLYNSLSKLLLQSYSNCFSGPMVPRYRSTFYWLAENQKSLKMGLASVAYPQN